MQLLSTLGRHVSAFPRRSHRSVRVIAVRVRAAQPDDASGIGRAHSEAWRVGFSELFESVWLRSAIADRRSRWSRLLPQCLADETEVLVAEAGGEVFGFTHFGPCDDDGEAGEVFALYVHPDHWGTGAAQLLTRHAIERLESQGFQRIVLWTPFGANRARAFYERNGWALTDRTAERDFGDGQPTQLLEYARDTRELRP